MKHFIQRVFQKESVALLQNGPYVDLHRRKQTYLYRAAIVTERVKGDFFSFFFAIARTIQHDVLSVHQAGAESRVETTDKEATALFKCLEFLGTIFAELV